MPQSEKDLALNNSQDAEKFEPLQSLEETETQWTEEEHKRLLKKIDWYLMPSECCAHVV